MGEEIKKVAETHGTRLHLDVNTEALYLLDNQHHVRRLKKTKPLDLVKCLVSQKQSFVRVLSGSGARVATIYINSWLNHWISFSYTRIFKET